ncbi:MAG: hypothetical protein ABI772_08035 [Bacteroidota bacterium]
METNKAPESDAVIIAREKEKTKRSMMLYGFSSVIVLIGLYFVFRGAENGGKRKVDVDLSTGKFSFSVDKPIVEQINQPTKEFKTDGKTVEFTTGKADESVVKQLNAQNISAKPTEFTGKNLVNLNAGYLLTVEHPEWWQVGYDPSGLSNPLQPINSVYSAEGEVFNVNKEQMQQGENLQQYVERNLNAMILLGLLEGIPDISYDKEYQTAFLTYTNSQTGGISYQKIVRKGNTAYAATANYNGSTTGEGKINDLVNMVASFTVIE